MTTNQTIDGVLCERDQLIRDLISHPQTVINNRLRTRALTILSTAEDSDPCIERVDTLVRIDRAYRDGVMTGFQFGVTGDEKGYADCIQRYNAGIQEAKSEQTAPVAVASRDESIGWLKRIDGIGQNRAELIYSMGFRRLAD